MIQIKKDFSTIPHEYLEYIERQHYRKEDFDAGFHKQLKGQSIFRDRLKKRKEFNQLKSKLIEDQGHICCYCNSRVNNDSTVEHIIPIVADKSLLAEYSNLLISCNTSRLEQAKDKSYPNHCDWCKGDEILPFTPLNDISWSAFRYHINGHISANALHSDIVIEMLGLDCTVLNEERRNALALIFDETDNLVTPEELEKIFMNYWDKDKKGMHIPYYYSVLNVIYDLI